MSTKYLQDFIHYYTLINNLQKKYNRKEDETIEQLLNEWRDEQL